MTIHAIAEQLVGAELRAQLALIDESKTAIRRAIGRNRTFSEGRTTRTNLSKIESGLRTHKLNEAS